MNHLWQLPAGRTAHFSLNRAGDFAPADSVTTVAGIPTAWVRVYTKQGQSWLCVQVPSHTAPGQYPISIIRHGAEPSDERTTLRVTLEITAAETASLALPTFPISWRGVLAGAAILMVAMMGLSWWWGERTALAATTTTATNPRASVSLAPFAQPPVVIGAEWGTALATPTLAPTPTLIPTPTPLPPLPTPQPPPTPPLTRGVESPVDGTYTYERMFQEVGAQFGVDWRLLASIAQRESQLNPEAVGGSGEQGMMQIMPATWGQFAPLVNESDPFNPYASTRVAAYYLVYLRDYLYSQGYTESYWLLVAYNWGPNNLRRHLADGGDWGSIPTMRQNYAYTIVNRVNDANDSLWTAGVKAAVP